MKILRMILINTFMLFPLQVMAQESNVMNAKNLLVACTTPDMEWISFCNGFFQAVNDQQTALGKLCLPSGTTRTRATEIFHEEAAVLLSKYPDQGLRPAIHVAGEILVKNFPCK